MATETYRLRDFLERSYATRLEEILRIAEKFDFDTLRKEYKKLKGVEFKADLENDIQRLLDEYPEIFYGAKAPKVSGYDNLADALRFIERSIELKRMPKVLTYPIKLSLTSYIPILLNAKCTDLIDRIEELGLRVQYMTFVGEKAFKEELVTEIKEKVQNFEEASDRADGITTTMTYAKLLAIASWVSKSIQNQSVNMTVCPLVATVHTYKSLCSLEPQLISYIEKYAALYNEELEKKEPDMYLMIRYLGFRKVCDSKYYKKLDFRKELRVAIQDLLDYDCEVLYGIHAPNINGTYAEYASVLYRIEMCGKSYQNGYKSLDVLLRDSQDVSTLEIDSKNFIIALRAVLGIQLSMLYYENLDKARKSIIGTLNRVWSNKSVELKEKGIFMIRDGASWKEISDWMGSYRFA